MKVAITGNRRLAEVDIGIIRAAVRRRVLDKSVKELIFGGAIGADTVALAEALAARPAIGTPQITVVLPMTVLDQPIAARPFIYQADTIVEMKQSRRVGNGMYRTRNEEMVRRAGRVVAFWDGVERGGTWMTMNIARRAGKPVEVVIIAGGDR